MLHLFTLIVLLTPLSQAKRTVTNTTLFELDLHGNAQKLQRVKDAVFQLTSNGTAYSHGLKAHKELVPGLDDGRSNLTRAQTDAIVDILYRTPVVVNRTECRAYEHLPVRACSGSNHTNEKRLREVVKGLHAGCKSAISALNGYAVERGIRACFDDNLPTNNSCAMNTLGCLGNLASTDPRIATQVLGVLHQPSLSKRSKLTSAGHYRASRAVALYKRATPPKELDNARKTALWTGIVTVLGIVGAIVTFIVGLWLGLPLGGMAIGFTVLGLLGAISGASSQFSVYSELGQAQMDIQSRRDISNTTEPVPVRPGYCAVFPSFKSCQ
ncbi:g713 [Coccomyxa elongata]